MVITRHEKIDRIQRYPQYTDYELMPFFAEVASGYCVKQAAQRSMLVLDWVMNTIYSDDDTCSHVLDLSMVATYRIRAGQMPIPDRWDRLFHDIDRGS